MVEENIIYIGKKPLMSYVLAALRQINDDDGTVVIKARGKSISRAVDVAEILRNQFVTTATIDDIEISTERLTSDDGKESNVSSIEIFMSTPGGEVPERTAPTETAPAEKTEEKADDGTDFFGEFETQ